MRKIIVYVITVILAVLIIGATIKYKLTTPIQLYHTTSSIISDKQVKDIYNNLAKYTGLSVDMLPQFIIVKDDSIVNAYQNPTNHTIAIYSGMIKFSNDPDEIAAILSHELSHFMLDHVLLNPDYDPNLQTVLEGNADKFGVYLMLRAGYNPCKAKDIWLKLRKIGGDYEYNSDHPNYSYRIWQFEFPICE